MKRCPNCRQPVEPAVGLCPNCGADTRALWQGAGETDEPVTMFGKRRRQDRIEMTLGFFVALILSCAIPLGLIGCGLSVVIGFFTQRSHPTFSKGMFIGSAAGVLGATYVCTRFWFPHFLHSIGD